MDTKKTSVSQASGTCIEALQARIAELEVQLALSRGRVGKIADCEGCAELEEQLAAQAGQAWQAAREQPERVELGDAEILAFLLNSGYECRHDEGLEDWFEFTKSQLFDVVRAILAAQASTQPVIAEAARDESSLEQAIMREIDRAHINNIRTEPAFGKLRGDIAVRADSLEAAIAASKAAQ